MVRLQLRFVVHEPLGGVHEAMVQVHTSIRVKREVSTLLQALKVQLGQAVRYPFRSSRGIRHNHGKGPEVLHQ